MKVGSGIDDYNHHHHHRQWRIIASQVEAKGRQRNDFGNEFAAGHAMASGQQDDVLLLGLGLYMFRQGTEIPRPALEWKRE